MEPCCSYAETPGFPTEMNPSPKDVWRPNLPALICFKWPNLSHIFVVFCLLILLINCAQAATLKEWTPRRGCHKVGHKRTISMPGCESVEVLLNACRGQCLSFSYPSKPDVIKANPSHLITSESRCCRMSDYEEVRFVVSCNDGAKEVVIPSATACQCFDCAH